MYAVEFETDAKEDVIIIPKKYKELFSKHIKIIAMVNEEKIQKNHTAVDSAVILEESLNIMKMQETSIFYKNVIGSTAEDVWDDLKPYQNISQEI